MTDEITSGVVREMFPKCIHCGQPCTDPKESVVVERKPGFRRLAHSACQARVA